MKASEQAHVELKASLARVAEEQATLVTRIEQRDILTSSTPIYSRRIRKRSCTPSGTS